MFNYSVVVIRTIKKLKQRAKESAAMRSNDPKITRIFQVAADTNFPSDEKQLQSQPETHMRFQIILNYSNYAH